MLKSEEDVHLMDDKRNKPRRKNRSRGRGGDGRQNRWIDGRESKRRNNVRERDGNVAKGDGTRLGRCSNCGGPAPDKTDLCRHCANIPKLSAPPETGKTEPGGDSEC